MSDMCQPQGVYDAGAIGRRIKRDALGCDFASKGVLRRFVGRPTCALHARYNNKRTIVAELG